MDNNYTISKEYLKKVLEKHTRTLVGVCMRRFEIFSKGLSNKELQTLNTVKADIKELIYECNRNLESKISAFSFGVKFVYKEKELNGNK